MTPQQANPLVTPLQSPIESHSQVSLLASLPARTQKTTLGHPFLTLLTEFLSRKGLHCHPPPSTNHLCPETFPREWLQCQVPHCLPHYPQCEANRKYTHTLLLTTLGEWHPCHSPPPLPPPPSHTLPREWPGRQVSHPTKNHWTPRKLHVNHL